MVNIVSSMKQSEVCCFYLRMVMMTILQSCFMKGNSSLSVIIIIARIIVIRVAAQGHRGLKVKKSDKEKKETKKKPSYRSPWRSIAPAGPMTNDLWTQGSVLTVGRQPFEGRQTLILPSSIKDSPRPCPLFFSSLVAPLSPLHLQLSSSFSPSLPVLPQSRTNTHKNGRTGTHTCL